MYDSRAGAPAWAGPRAVAVVLRERDSIRHDQHVATLAQRDGSSPGSKVGLRERGEARVTELVPGAIIAAKFRLERVIGKGGMGSVWAAKHAHLDMPVALKFMDPLADSPEARVRFEREAKAAASLRSPHVVQILDHGLDDGVPYIAMELLEGEDLGERLRRDKRLDLVVASRIFTQAAKALKKAHDAGIIHRDLKPSNIFLARFDEDEVVKLLDFGVAKLRSPGSALDPNSQATQTGVVFGSPSYMSPEQARGVRVLDHKTDLWSLAVILFRTITGEKPFLGDSIGDLVIKLCIDPLPIATQIAPDLPPAIDAFFERAFAREPEQRFPDAMGLAAAFESIVSGKPMKPVLPTASPLGSQAPRPPKLAGAPAPPLAHAFAPVAPATPASGSLLAPVSLTPPPDSGVSGGSSFRVRKQELGEVGQVVASERTGPNAISGPNTTSGPNPVSGPQAVSGRHAAPPSFVPTPPPSSTGASFAPGAWPGESGPHVPRPPMPSTGTLVLPQGANVPSGTPPSGAMAGWNPGLARGATFPMADVPHSPQPGVIDIADAHSRGVDIARPPPSSLSIFAHDLLERAKRVDDGTRRRAAVAFASAITLLVVIFGLVSIFNGSGHEAVTNPSPTASAGPESIAPAAPGPSAEVSAAVTTASAAPAPAPAAPTTTPSAAPTTAPSAEATDEPESSAPSAAPAPTWQRGPLRPKPSSSAAKKNKKPNFGY